MRTYTYHIVSNRLTLSELAYVAVWSFRAVVPEYVQFWHNITHKIASILVLASTISIFVLRLCSILISDFQLLVPSGTLHIQAESEIGMINKKNGIFDRNIASGSTQKHSLYWMPANG